MNWTGGALERSRNFNGTLALQKKHFAKARAKAEANRAIALDFPEWRQGKSNIHLQAEENLDHSQRSSQRTLDEFRETKPVVERLRNIRPRHQSKKRQSTSADDDDDEGMNVRIKREASPISISSRCSSSTTSSVENEHAPNRSYGQANVYHTLNSNSIEAQRLRLLNTNDWVGLNRTRPAKIIFTAAEDRDQIGKRRRISQVPHRPPVRQLKNLRRGSYFGKLRRSPPPSQEYLSQADVSVRIGSAVDRSVRERVHGRASSREESCSGEDEMLLDDDGAQPEDRYPNPFAPSGGLVERSPIPPNTMLELRSPVDSPFSTLPYQEAGEYWVGDGFHEKSAQISDPAIEATKLKEEIEQYQADEGPQIHLDYAKTAPVKRSSQVLRSSSPVVRDFAYLGNIEHHPSAHLIRKDESTSPLSSVPSDYLASLHVEAFQQDKPTPDQPIRQYRTSPSHGPLREQSRLASISNNKKSINVEVIPENPNAKPCTIVEKQKELTKEDVVDGGNENTTPVSHEQIITRPLSLAETKKGQPVFFDTFLPQIGIPAIPIEQQKEAASSSTPGKQSHGPEPVQDEESFWRSFVFGDDDPTNNEWILEEPEDEESHLQVQSSSPTHLYQSQPSMVAETATSPIKQNPHLVDELMTSHTQSSSSPARDNRSMRAEAGNESSGDGSGALEAQILDDLPLTQRCSFDILPPSSAATMASTTPPTPILKTLPRQYTTPSSTKAQASSTPLPSFSIDPSNNSPTRTFHSHHKTQSSRLPLQVQAYRQAAILFRKPARYTGSHSSDPVEQLVLGGSRRRTSTRRKAKGLGGIIGGLTGLEGEETTGLGWVEGEGDEIEDAD